METSRIPETGPFERILLAVDEFQPSQDALAWAAALAPAAVEVVTVLPRPPTLLRGGDQLTSAGAMTRGLQRLEAEATARLQSLVASPPLQGIRTGIHVEHGNPVEAILGSAAKFDSDLVVVGPHGSATAPMHLGSVADGVRHRSTASVLIAKGPPPPNSIAVGTDGSAPAHRAVDIAAKLAADFAVPLEVIQAHTPHAPETPTIERMRQSYPLAVRVPRSRFVLTELPPRSALLEASQPAGLLVMGSRGLGALRSRLLGSVSEKVSQDAVASVLIVR